MISGELKCSKINCNTTSENNFQLIFNALSGDLKLIQRTKFIQIVQDNVQLLNSLEYNNISRWMETRQRSVYKIREFEFENEARKFKSTSLCVFEPLTRPLFIPRNQINSNV